LELKVIKQLLDAGVNLRQARRAIECLRESVGEDLTTANLVLIGEGSVLVRTGEEIIDLLRGGQGVFNIVPLAGVVGEVDAAILRIKPATQAQDALPAQAGQPTRTETAPPSATRIAEGG
jgi:DNA-binding transcriptional MerR regulator